MMKGLFTSAMLVLSLLACSPRPDSASRAREAGQEAGLGGKGYGTADVDPVVERFLGLVNDAARLQPRLDKAMDQRGKLMLELVANIGAGCMMDVAVRSIQVRINGKELEDLDATADLANTQYARKEGDDGTTPTEFLFSFGNFSKSLGSQPAAQIFTVDSELNFSPPSKLNFTIGDLKTIKITKLHPAYKYRSLSSEEEWKETQRFELDSIEVRINKSLLIYRRGDIDFAFSANIAPGRTPVNSGLIWEDKNVIFNDAFVAILQEERCAGQM